LGVGENKISYKIFFTYGLELSEKFGPGPSSSGLSNLLFFFLRNYTDNIYNEKEGTFEVLSFNFRLQLKYRFFYFDNFGNFSHL